MIVTKEGCIEVAVGEVFSYNGRVYKCLPDLLSGSKGCEECVFQGEPRVCRIMECRGAVRSDGQYVDFKLFEEEEGGEDDNQ